MKAMTCILAMTDIALMILGGIACNLLIGAAVHTAADDEDQRLYRWYTTCPTRIAWFACPLVLMAWPIGLWLWWKKGETK